MSKKSDRSKFLKLARDRFNQAEEANKNQRQRELDDLRFYAGDQWPEDIRTARAGQQANQGMPAVPARPCITVNKARKPVRQVLNQERGADMGIEIVPADDFGDISEPIPETEIQLREGLVRRIQRESKASDARTWAFTRAVIAGVGYYAVLTRYVPGKSRDKEVYVDRIFNQACVAIDPAHEQPDGSDAEWEFIWTDMPWARYKAKYKKRNGEDNRVCSWTDSEWRTAGDEAKDWFDGEGDMRTVRVGTYFYADYTPREVVTYQSPDGTQANEITTWLDEMPDPPEGFKEIERHSDMQRTIKVATIDGCDDDVLDETDLEGPDMPLVKVLGEELQPYDKERRTEGMIRPMREPGQGFNVMVSSWVERIGYAPLPPLMMVEGQAEGYEQMYAAANTRALPFLYYKNSDIEGKRVDQAPFVPDRGLGQVIGPLAQSVQLFDQAIQDTSTSNPALGLTDASVKSAKHANLLRDEGQQGTSNYLDNLQRSMRYEAQIINNLLYPIYGRPGRLARIMNGEGEAESVILHQPMTLQQGRPVPAGEGMQGAKTYTLTKDARFNIAIKISKDFDTRRQQENAELSEFLSAAPQFMTVFGDLYFKTKDGPGHVEMAERMKVMLDPKVLQLIESKKQGQEPPSPQLQQAQQQIQQLTQVAQQLQQQLQTDAVKEQAETQRNAAKLQADQVMERERLAMEIEKVRIQEATKLQIEEYKLRGAQMQAEIDRREAELGAQQVREDRQHEVGMAAMSGVQSAQGSEADRRHQAEMAERGQQAQSGEAEAARAHEAMMAERAAAQAAQETTA